MAVKFAGGGMLIYDRPRGEHVLSPAAAPVSAACYACKRLCVLPRYLDASVPLPSSCGLALHAWYSCTAVQILQWTCQ